MTDPAPASFTRVMTEHDDLTHRLSDLGAQEVPGATRTEHVHAMRTAAPVDTAPTGPRFGRVAVAAAAIVGFAVGSTGFAMAGALPDPAQGVAHDVLAVVQVQVPDRPDNRGACISVAAKIDDAAAKRAAKDQCPKGGPPAGVPGGGPPDGVPGRGEGVPPGQVGKAPKGPNADDDPCTGKPPWAGPMSPEERAAAKDACPGRADADDGAGELEEPAG